VERTFKVGESAEMYLKTIAELALHRDLVPVTSVAERLGISTVSASEMIRRLAEKDLLIHEPYKGVYLTETGRKEANGVIRRQRLWERFLVDKLGIAWELVHDMACRLEHATDAIVTDALDEFLKHPTTCPHGNPIPSTTGLMPSGEGTPLSGLLAGEKGLVLRIHPVSEEIVRYLDERGVEPGKVIEVREITPLDGLQAIVIDGEPHVLGRMIASHIIVRHAGDPS
jgi:DtxR family Mn-dependent transcriptional regulator